MKLFRFVNEVAGQYSELAWIRIIWRKNGWLFSIILPLYSLQEKSYDIMTDQIRRYMWCLPYLAISKEVAGCLTIRWGLLTLEPLGTVDRYYDINTGTEQIK